MIYDCKVLTGKNRTRSQELRRPGLSRLCSHKSSASVTSSSVSLVKPCPLDKPVHVDSGYTTPTNCDNNNSNKNTNILTNGNTSKPTSNSKLERTKLSCTETHQN